MHDRRNLETEYVAYLDKWFGVDQVKQRVVNFMEKPLAERTSG